MGDQYPTGKQYSITDENHKVIITEVGATLRSYTIDGIELLDGFSKQEMSTAARGQVLCPWPNRISGGKYTFEGADLQLPINEVTLNNAIHGLVRWLNWKLDDHTKSSVTLSVILRPQDGYPFSLHITITYRLKRKRLHITTSSKNVGKLPLPYGFGQHPYFLADVDAAYLKLPAKTWLVTNPFLIPINIAPVEGTPFDFRQGKAIGSLQLDTGFTDLIPDANCRSKITLEGTAEGVRRLINLYLDKNYTVVQIFTGDTLPPGQTRRSVAIEPYTCAANAFNNKIGLVVIDPDQTFTHAYVIEASLLS